MNGSDSREVLRGKLSKFRDMWYYCSAANLTLLGHIQLCIIH